jgi:transcriptional regulator with XRE-family HTH domain
MENTKRKYYPRLRELRVGAGMNQTEIAEILNMQQNQYSRYERGERELPMHLFVKLAAFYNVSLDYMAGLSDHRERA